MLALQAHPHLEGGDLSIFWVIPFVGILLSIAIFPLVALITGIIIFGKISAFWATLLIIPFIFKVGFSITLYEILHVGLLEYIPFIILLLALFTISGGSVNGIIGWYSNHKYRDYFCRYYACKLDGNNGRSYASN